MTQGTTKEVALNCVQIYADMEDWLRECPAEDEQPYYGTAVHDFRGLFETGHAALLELGVPMLAERFRELHAREIPEAADKSWLIEALNELVMDIDENTE